MINNEKILKDNYIYDKPKLTFETYEPTDEEREVYYNIMNKLRMANS